MSENLTIERDQARTELKNVKELFEEAVRQKDEAHHLLGKERDEFGKKEIELMRENEILKNFIEERQTKIQELTKELKRLKNINVRPASWVAVLNDHDRRVEGLQAELEAAQGENDKLKKMAMNYSMSELESLREESEKKLMAEIGLYQIANEKLETLCREMGEALEQTEKTDPLMINFLKEFHRIILAKYNQHFQEERL